MRSRARGNSLCRSADRSPLGNAAGLPRPESGETRWAAIGFARPVRANQLAFGQVIDQLASAGDRLRDAGLGQQ
jgi:hypothetical protein